MATTERQQKVTMVLSHCDKTGMTTHTLDLTKALVKRGVDVTLIVGYRKGKDATADGLYERFKQTGVKIKTFLQPNRSSLTKVLSGISLIYRLLSTGGGDIHIQSPYLSWAPWLIRRRFVSTFHVNDLRPSFYYKKATHLIAISNETKEYAMRNFGYKDRDITIVNHGVDERFVQFRSNAEIANIRRELGLPTDKLLILLVGSIEPRKGQDILIKAVSGLDDAVKDMVHVVLLGSDKTEGQTSQKWLEETIAKFGMEKHVSHFEYMDSVTFYKISDIFVLPSWLEGFPLVVIEAMLSGCLVIRSDSEGAFEQIKHGETGFIFPKGEAERLKKYLNEVIINSSLRKQMATSGCEYALHHFTADNMAKQTIEVYKKSFKWEIM